MFSDTSNSSIDSAQQKLLDKVSPATLKDQELVTNNRDFSWVTNKICKIVESNTPNWWWVCMTVALATASFTLMGLIWLVSTGVGVWGLANPINWGWAIVNFVFWIGIGHAGTLISAILCLLKQGWRTSINRAAEAMTIFAVSTYGTVSVLFWYMGMIPDLGILRDRAVQRLTAGIYQETSKLRSNMARCADVFRKYFYGVLAMGWRNAGNHWRNYEMAYLLLAGLSTPLVLSVHTIVSFDFAVAVLPGWHTTIFPPYFVAGAIFSGFGMVLTLMLPLRALYGLHDLITQRHIDNMCKICLGTGSIVGYAYIMEFFIAWYGANPYESFAFINRAFGQYSWAYYIMFSCNVFTPQLFWFKAVRENAALVWIMSILINVGMWFERFVITVTSLANDFLPSSWGYYSPTIVDIFTFAGTFGLFSTLFLMFLRFLPLMPIGEIKFVMPQADPHGHHEDGKESH